MSNLHMLQDLDCLGEEVVVVHVVRLTLEQQLHCGALLGAERTQKVGQLFCQRDWELAFRHSAAIADSLLAVHVNTWHTVGLPMPTPLLTHGVEYGLGCEEERLV